ncbi:MAG: ATP-dependent dethiobiotin synthetase BioD [Sphingomonas sp.]|nr:ATP-dependent dethiobiotin synthetase BioD [Sphingomonas sp.]
MSGVLIVSGTDTGIGKTVAAAGLAAALGAHYWKPIQAGTADGTDSADAQRLGVPTAHVLPEAYRLALPASPHLAAERESVMLDPARLALPSQRPLIVEGAGGLMVPIRREPPWLMIDQFAQWRAPVLLVARTGLGTINHSLLSIEALRSRGVTVAGLLFVGEAHTDNEAIVPLLGGVRSLGRLPVLDPLDAAGLADAMAQHVDLEGLRAVLG